MFSASGYKAALESKLLAPVSRSPKVENVKTVRSEVPKIESERIPLPVLLSVGVPGTKVPAWYLQKIRDKIDANWNLRKKFALSGEKVLISFCIQQNGVISKLSLDRQAKSSTFNDSAMEAVQKSIPFPPLPQEINVSSLDITIAFSAKGIQ
jgi:TonB family protein